jgi:hypothetical protein
MDLENINEVFADMVKYLRAGLKKKLSDFSQL